MQGTQKAAPLILGVMRAGFSQVLQIRTEGNQTNQTVFFEKRMKHHLSL